MEEDREMIYRTNTTVIFKDNATFDRKQRLRMRKLVYICLDEWFAF